MNSNWLHIAIKQRFLECRRAAHEGTITPEEAGEIYAALGEELAEHYGHELAERAMREFTNDLHLLTFMERIDQLGWLAVAFGHLTAIFMSDQRIDRVTQLNDAILELDTQYYEPD